MRRILSLIAALLAFTGPSNGQDWPARPLPMVVPFAAGGPMDSLARILQPTLGETIGQPIIIENQPGGGGMTGSLRVSQAASDSHLFSSEYLRRFIEAETAKWAGPVKAAGLQAD